MKMKNLLQTTTLIFVICLLNQFANAQCSGNKVRLCRCVPCASAPDGRTAYVCVSQGQVNQYLSNGWQTQCSCYCSPFHLPRTSEGENISKTSLTEIKPNPVSYSTTIVFTLSQFQKVSLKIFDMNGKLVSTLTNKNFEAGQNQIEFTTEKFEAGIYFLKMETGENLFTKKIIVTK